MIDIIDEILELLSDGNVYDVEYIRNRLRLSYDVCLRILSFLSQYGFINLDLETGKVQISRNLLNLLKELNYM